MFMGEKVEKTFVFVLSASSSSSSEALSLLSSSLYISSSLKRSSAAFFLASSAWEIRESMLPNNDVVAGKLLENNLDAFSGIICASVFDFPNSEDFAESADALNPNVVVPKPKLNWDFVSAVLFPMRFPNPPAAAPVAAPNGDANVGFATPPAALLLLAAVLAAAVAVAEGTIVGAGAVVSAAAVLRKAEKLGRLAEEPNTAEEPKTVVAGFAGAIAGVVAVVVTLGTVSGFTSALAGDNGSDAGSGFGW